MGDVALTLAAALLGLVTADLFTRVWTEVLRAAATLTLGLRGQIDSRTLWRRLGMALPRGLLSALVLALAFTLYFRVLGLGASGPEQLGYFIGAFARTGAYLVGVGRLIDAMLDPGDKS